MNPAQRRRSPRAIPPLSLRTFDQLHRFVASEVAKSPRILAFLSMADGASGCITR